MMGLTIDEVKVMLRKPPQLPFVTQAVWDKKLEGTVTPYLATDERIMNIIKSRVDRERVIGALGTAGQPTRIEMTITEKSNIPVLLEYTSGVKPAVSQISFPVHTGDSPTAILWKVFGKDEIISCLSDEKLKGKPVGSSKYHPSCFR